LRSKVKVPQKSFWNVTHRLMVMHPHTKYNWTIWKDKKVMVRTSFAEKKRKKKKWRWKKRRRKKKSDSKQYVSLRSKGRHNYDIWSWKSMSWLGADTFMWQGLFRV
jgi:hypothetical protein